MLYFSAMMCAIPNPLEMKFLAGLQRLECLQRINCHTGDISLLIGILFEEDMAPTTTTNQLNC